MPRSRRRAATGVAFLALGSLLIATLAGCGSSDDGPPKAAPSAVATDIAPPTATAQQTFGGQGLSSFALERLSKSLTEAISSGDEKRFLSVIDPRHPRLLAQQRTWFRNIRSVPMSQRKLVLVKPTRSIDSSGKGVLTALVGFDHQIKGADPRPLSEWYSFGFKRVGSNLKVVSVSGGPPDTSAGKKYSRYYRQAWDDGPMATVGDDKVLLLGQQSDRGTLQGLLPRVSSAVRDQLAEFRRSGADVDASVYSRRWVFTFAAADVKDFFDYFGGSVQPHEADFAAVTNPVFSSYSFGELAYDKGVTSSRIVLNRELAGYSGQAFASVIRHEMVHAVQETWDAKGSPRTPTWVTEGLAVAFSRPPSSEAGFRASSGRRGLAHSTRFPSTQVFYAGGNDVVAQHYGMGYLAMAYLFQKRGTRAVLDLVRKFDRSGQSSFFTTLGVSQKAFLARVKTWAGA